MAKKRRNICASDEEPRFFVDRNEVMKLTKVAKSWEFTCSFCFKKFPSAQAMGGHQNAHRNERMEEKRLFVRDPISYRKRAYIQALKSSFIELGPNPNPNPNPRLNLHAALRMVKYETANFKVVRRQSNILPKPPQVGVYGGKNFPASFRVMNFFPVKELNLAESVGVSKACSEYNDVVGWHKVDLTLKL